MRLPNVRKVAVSSGDGRIRVVEQEIPLLGQGLVMVKVHASLISPGTELGGWRHYSALRETPDPSRPETPFGYSNAGTVLAVGDGVRAVAVGDRVACMGWGCALHADYAVIPQNLCVTLPDNVTFAQGSYLALAGTALQTVRRCEPILGEWFCVAGLGLVGLLTARLLQLSGAFVIGWSRGAARVDIARRWGIDASVDVAKSDGVTATQDFTGGAGLDGAVVAFGGDADSTLRSIERCMKVSPDGHAMGRIAVVGGATFEFTTLGSNLDYRRISRTGPGYHDHAWELGEDYPSVFVRWDTMSNLRLCARLISEGRLDVDSLTTHRIPLSDAERRVDAILDDPASILGVVFACDE